MQHVVKRAGHTEPYDDKKIYATVFSVCQSLREPAASAELIADKVAADVSAWIKTKHEVTANDIRNQAAKHLQNYNPDAAYLLKHHRVVW